MAIVVDAMGAEGGVDVSVTGAVNALAHIKDDLTLVGDRHRIEAALGAHRGVFDRSRVTIIHTDDTVSMTDKPRDSLRKRDSSLAVAMRLVRNDDQSAFVSAANTGATLAHAMFTLGRMPGVDRPCIAVTIPTPTGHLLVSDAGANVNCRPAHLVQFALMTETFFSNLHGSDSPRVAVISNGEEDVKGNDLTRQTAQSLRQIKSMNFQGYIEGRRLMMGDADVAICDGFVGNIVLKTIEGAAGTLAHMTREALQSRWTYKLGGMIIKNALKLKSRVDYSEYGGAPLLGVTQAVFICHGSSNSKAIMNAVVRASRFVELDVTKQIQQRLDECPIDPLW
jgi:glycerol-3-phosphate acyltransferase PlsX